MEYSVNYLFLLSVCVLFVWLIAAYAFRTYNNLVFTLNNARKAFANIDVLLQQRNDEIPNLVNIVTELTSHERALLKELVELRSQFPKDIELATKVSSHNSLSARLFELQLRLESYPSLISNRPYQELNERITQLENKIELQAKFFNDAATLYNNFRAPVPAICFAWIFSFPYQPLLSKREVKEND